MKSLGSCGRPPRRHPLAARHVPCGSPPVLLVPGSTAADDAESGDAWRRHSGLRCTKGEVFSLPRRVPKPAAKSGEAFGLDSRGDSEFHPTSPVDFRVRRAARRRGGGPTLHRPQLPIVNRNNRQSTASRRAANPTRWPIERARHDDRPVALLVVLVQPWGWGRSGRGATDRQAPGQSLAPSRPARFGSSD
jgi:hypothetical protein